MITRLLEARLRQTQKSCLLLGPRQSGKSTLMAESNPDLTLNLAHEPTFLAFASNPAELEERLAAVPGAKLVFIDEVQRLPSLLNTLQTLIDSKTAPRFLLTGSSARKLRRGGGNLLPGRIFTYYLGPIVAAELNYQLPLREALETGTLPGMLVEEDPATRRKLLSSYAASYLAEEVQAESLSRNLEGFARFLKIAAQWSGHFLDLSKLGQAAQVARQSVVRWFEVLEDTLLVRRIDAFAPSLSKKLVRHPKFYFFDVGVLNGLLGNFTASPDRAGLLFEHLIANQLIDAAAAHDKAIELFTYRTAGGVEVDFVAEFEGQRWAIELKASTTVGGHDLRGLRNLRQYARPARSMVWYLGTTPRRIEDIEVLPWQTGLKEMGL